MEIIKRLKELDFIDEVVVMPTYLNPFKSSFVAPASLRLEWLDEIFKDDPKIRVSDFEVQQNRAVTTYESALKLLKSYDKLYIAIGSDNLATLDKWHNFDKLAKVAEFIIFTRGKRDLSTPYKVIEIDIPTSSSALRKEIKKELLPQKVAQKIYKYYKEKHETKS